MAVITIIKELGETMGQLLDRVKSKHKISKEISVTYCGRLDPAATGDCIFLTGQDVYKKDEYLQKDKVYTARILVGVQTDTDDLLGVVKKVLGQGKNPQDFCPDVIDAFRAIPKTIMQAPHEFSSFKIEGKPLWHHTKNQNQKITHIPLKKRNIYRVDYKDSGSTTKDELLQHVDFLCTNVVGDFRQKEILTSWKKASLLDEYPYIEFSFSVSAGTYIRSLVHSVSNNCKVPLVLLMLHRTKIR